MAVSRATSDRDVGRELTQRGVADAVDLEQLVDRREAAVLVAPGRIASAVTGPTSGSASSCSWEAC